VSIDNSLFSFDLNVVIVKHGFGSRVISLAKACGISGGTIVFGKGISRNSLLRLLEIADSSNEVVLILSDKVKGDDFIQRALLEFRLEKPNRGIAFKMPVCNILCTRCHCSIDEEHTESEVGKMSSYSSIFVIVDKGVAGLVVKAGRAGGARGATIIDGRGAGIHETSKLFAMEIEPEKEIVLLIVPSDLTKSVSDMIREKVGMDEAGKGIIFVQEVSEVYGLN